MAGDVASAFRNISIHSNSVYLFAGHIEEDDVIVIELAAPFGWTGSPGFYEIAGGAVAYVHGSHTTDEFPDGIPDSGYSRSGRHLAAYLRAHSVADSTVDQYRRALTKWTTWTTRHGIPPTLAGKPLAVQVQHISDFILHGFQYGFGSGGPIRSDSIMAVPLGVRHFFAASGHDFPISHPHICMLLKGISRLDSPPRRKAPVSIDLLEVCFRSLAMTEPFEQALCGVMCLAFFFLLRRSEIVAIAGGSFKWFAVRAQDIAVLDEEGRPTLAPSKVQSVCMRLTGSKTNQDGSPTTRMLSRSGHPFLCPVFGALILLQVRKNLPADIPAAVYLDRRGKPACVGTADVAEAIKRAAVSTGQDPRCFSSHSLRAGGATHMYRAGTDALTIQFHGRWVSDAFKTYTRLCKESVASLAESMCRSTG
ncbi:hypothetical protein PF005_g8887 [Phytophthora fragariae]|uniref:Tyr recombinase domain-containing protein n=1 Tax=Phytophthora fragariae TaxID=53985 RepID=A0A6A3YDH2_9STRA|nr:hypothetical protein PF005_g8887 [Phytophthora fragariae]